VWPNNVRVFYYFSKCTLAEEKEDKQSRKISKMLEGKRKPSDESIIRRYINEHI